MFVVEMTLRFMFFFFIVIEVFALGLGKIAFTSLYSRAFAVVLHSFVLFGFFFMKFFRYIKICFIFCLFCFLYKTFGFSLIFHSCRFYCRYVVCPSSGLLVFWFMFICPLWKQKKLVLFIF